MKGGIILTADIPLKVRLGNMFGGKPEIVVK
jgi:hypothetical protein